jgi:hypothetical protein
MGGRNFCQWSNQIKSDAAYDDAESRVLCELSDDKGQFVGVSYNLGVTESGGGNLWGHIFLVERS